MKNALSWLLALLYGLRAMGLKLHLGNHPWSPLGQVFELANPLFLGNLILTLALAAVPVEVRLGRWALGFAWGMTAILQMWLRLPLRAELSCLSVAAVLLLFSWVRGDQVPWKVWLPLLALQGLTLWLVQPSLLALACALGPAAAVVWWHEREPLKVVGMACTALLVVGWAS
jgi:hypothetical protein